MTVYLCDWCGEECGGDWWAICLYCKDHTWGVSGQFCGQVCADVKAREVHGGEAPGGES